MKQKLRRVYEPDMDTVHYCAVGNMDAVTLCGHTDWIGEQNGEETTEPVTCCMSMVKAIQDAKKEV